MAFSDIRYRWLHAQRKLQVFWFMLAVSVVFAVLAFAGFHEHGPGREIVAATPAKVLRINRVPEIADDAHYYAAPTPWLVEVDFGASRVEVAEMPLMPQVGETVCVVHAKSPLRGSTFEVIGYIDAMASRGKTCELAGRER